MRTETSRIPIDDAYDLPHGTKVALIWDGSFLDERRNRNADLILQTAALFEIGEYGIQGSSGWRDEIEAVLFTEGEPQPRTIIDTLPITEARLKYHEDTPMVVTSVELGPGYFNRNKGITRDATVNSADIWTVGEGRDWGRHMIAHIIKASPSQEELDKMGPGQRLAEVIKTAANTKPADPLDDPDWVIKEASRLAKALDNYGTVTCAMVLIMCTSEAFTAKFLSEEEQNIITGLTHRMVMHYQGKTKVSTPNSRVVNSVMNNSAEDIF